MNKFILLVVGVLTIAAGVAALVYRSNVPTSKGMQHYSNELYGISFNYPSSFQLDEVPLQNQAGKHIIALTAKNDQRNIPEGSEGPPAITVQIFNDPSRTTLVDWVRVTRDANFALSTNGNINMTSLAGAEAVRYVWDGLYIGESVVTRRGDHVFMFSVTYHAPTDMIRTHFIEMLSTVSLARR